MRALITYKLIQSLTKIKPADVSGKVQSGLKRSIRDLDEGDVRKESVATLALFKWLHTFFLCSEMLAKA
jgi:hypothetical protein